MTFSVYLLIFKIFIPSKMTSLFPVLMDQLRLKLKMSDLKIYSPLISNLLCFLISSFVFTLV